MHEATRSSGTLPTPVWSTAIAVAVLGVVAAVLVNASERHLVMLSYALVPLLAFGIAGLALGRRIRPAVITALVALVGLFLFMELIFPRL